MKVFNVSSFETILPFADHEIADQQVHLMED